MFQEEKRKPVYVAVQQKYRVSTNYDEYISLKGGTFKLIRSKTSKYI
jgi:hypothetical protein